MYAESFKLCVTASDKYIIEKRFSAVNKLHNELISHAKKLINRLYKDHKYQDVLNEYCSLKSREKPNNKTGREKLLPKEKARMKELSEWMSVWRKNNGLTKFDFEAYAKVWRIRYTNLVTSQQMQAEADRVWNGVENVLFGKGKTLHYRKISEVHSIGGKSNLNGARFNPEDMSVNWLGLHIPCKINRNDPYVREALHLNNPDELIISYCIIKREAFKNGWHYYANVCIRGNAPDKGHHAGENTMGIDPGVSTMAGVSDDRIFLRELAPDISKFDKKIADLLKGMDVSRRAANPDNFNSNGIIKRKEERKKWTFSKHYINLRWELRDTYRRRAEYIKTFHGTLANEIMEDSKNFIVEKTDFAALAKRSKKTAEREEKKSLIQKKDGSEIEVQKFKRKKRFGHSINSRAPSGFLTILKNKAEAAGGSWTEIDPKEFKASQYHHDTEEYIRAPLSERFKTIDGHLVQRDLYSAFLILNANGNMPDRNKCIENFDLFCCMQDEEIALMKAGNISMKQCFGF